MVFLIGKICLSNLSTDSVTRAQDKTINAKEPPSSLIHVRVFLSATINRNSYKPQWCRRPTESQNRLVVVFCSAGARGKSRRDLPSSHTTAGHQTAASKQKHHLVNSSPGESRLAKPLCSQMPSKTKLCKENNAATAAFRLMELSHCTLTKDPASTVLQRMHKHS